MLDFLKGILQTRGSQLLSRYIGIGLTALATKLGTELKDGESAATALATLVIAGICFVIDHYSHKKQAEEK